MEHIKGKAEYQDSSDRIIIVGGPNRNYICTVQIKQTCGGTIGGLMECSRRANAERIKLCWNSHDDLLAACEELAEIFPEHSMSELDAADFKDRAARIWTASQSAKNIISKARNCV